MNEEFSSYIKGKSVTLLGFGVSNAPLVEKFREWGASGICIRDRRPREDVVSRFPFLEKAEVSAVFGEDYLSGINTDIVLKTPGIRFDLPELLEAKERGCEISSETELFFRFCKAKKIAVSGSDGKSTTTTLINEILKASGVNTVLGGNIGTPLLHRIHEVGEDVTVVAELSSFQLHTMSVSPDVAVITNISPNHLDWHRDFDEYMDAKSSLLRYQNENGVAVLNLDCPNSKRYFTEVKGKLLCFSRRSELENGAYLSGDTVFFCENGKAREMLKLDGIKLPGMHNVENYMAAICATAAFANEEAVRKVAENFGGVPHRLQLVREKDGVRFYNSSIDSSPSRTNAALSSFPKTKQVIIICGGRDKHVPFDSLSKQLAEKTKAVVLTGEAAEKIFSDIASTEEYKNGLIRFEREPDFEKAVRLSASLAEKGDTVLLSPACTSFDRFRNFEERGEFFTNIVNSL